MYVDDKKVAIVTGCSSGIGLETSKILAKNGFYTYATMRNTDKIQETDRSIRENSGGDNLPLQIIRLDVNDDTSVHNAIDTILSERKTIDILVNNAGYALVGPFRRDIN